jgi:DNA-binding response OmpR family regulator
MPGMGGIKFYQEVKRTNPQQVGRIIFTTGDTLNEGNQEFIRMTGCTLLMKPFTLDSLLNLIAARLEQFKT